MNHFLYEMLGRQRFEEMLREAAEEARFPALPRWRPVGRALIQVGRRLERMGEHLVVDQAGSAQRAGGLR